MTKAEIGGLACKRASRDPACGQAMTEYLILTGLIGLVLIIGQESPLEALFRAFQAAWGRFSWALSMP